MKVDGSPLPPLSSVQRETDKTTLRSEAKALDFLTCLNRLVETAAGPSRPSQNEVTNEKLPEELRPVEPDEFVERLPTPSSDREQIAIEPASFTKLSSATRIGDRPEAFSARAIISPASEEFSTEVSGQVAAAGVETSATKRDAAPESLPARPGAFDDVLNILTKLLDQSPPTSRAASGSPASVGRRVPIIPPPIANDGLPPSARPSAITAAISASANGEPIQPAEIARSLGPLTLRAPSDSQRLVWVAPGPDGFHLSLRANRLDQADRSTLESAIERLFLSYGHRLSGISYVGGGRQS